MYLIFSKLLLVYNSSEILAKIFKKRLKIETIYNIHILVTL